MLSKNECNRTYMSFSHRKGLLALGCGSCGGKHWKVSKQPQCQTNLFTLMKESRHRWERKKTRAAYKGQNCNYSAQEALELSAWFCLKFALDDLMNPKPKFWEERIFKIQKSGGSF
jgi:hypothetical protein